MFPSRPSVRHSVRAKTEVSCQIIVVDFLALGRTEPLQANLLVVTMTRTGADSLEIGL
jgi:hypothetical protein